jgi:hypothetical protein
MEEDSVIMCGEHQFITETGCITYSNMSNNTVHIDRVFTVPSKRKKGCFKKNLKKFLGFIEANLVTACIMPDRTPNGEYDHDLEDGIIRTFKSLGFVPTDFDGESWDTDLELNRISF